jgi:hypothetical protein
MNARFALAPASCAPLLLTVLLLQPVLAALPGSGKAALLQAVNDLPPVGHRLRRDMGH